MPFLDGGCTAAHLDVQMWIRPDGTSLDLCECGSTIRNSKTDREIQFENKQLPWQNNWGMLEGL